MPKLFTPDEANALLPELQPILEELRSAVEQLEEVSVEAAETRDRIRGNGHLAHAEPLDRQRAAQAEATRLVARLAELGVEIKDPRIGLVDFPSQRGDRIAYLCWKLGEPSVAYWHPLDTGFAGRQPL